MAYKAQYFWIKLGSHFVLAPSFSYWLLLICKSRIDLGYDLFVREVLEINGIRGTFCIAKTVPLAKNRIHPGFSALLGLNELDGTIRTGGYTGPARYAIFFIDLTDGTGNSYRIVREKC